MFNNTTMNDIAKLSTEEKEVISTARKYNLRPGNIKCEIFRLFDKGYSPTEVRYIWRNYFVDRRDPLR